MQEGQAFDEKQGPGDVENSTWGRDDSGTHDIREDVHHNACRKARPSM